MENIDIKIISIKLQNMIVESEEILERINKQNKKLLSVLIKVQNLEIKLTQN